MSDLTTSRSLSSLSLSDTFTRGSGGRAKKPRSGCTGCLVGCLAILLLICCVFAGMFAYIYYMDKDEALGAIALQLIKNQSINISITTDINSNQNIPFAEKRALHLSYDKFLSDYDTFPQERQNEIKKNLGRLIKKFINNPLLLQTEETPAELKELITLIIPDQQLFQGRLDADIIEHRIWLEVLSEYEASQKAKRSKSWKKLSKKRRYSPSP